MENLIALQDELYSRMNKSQINFRKCSKDRKTSTYVKNRIENLDKIWFEFVENHKQLFKTIDRAILKETTYIKRDLYDMVEEFYCDYRAELSMFLNDNDTNSHVNRNSNSSDKEFQVKLPKISIPMFSGKYSEWTTFRDLFISLVHKNSSLDNVQKMHYLKGHLTGEAEQLVRQVPVSDANYNQCWEQLERRYNNKKYLANCILKRFFAQKRMNIESSNGLKDLLDTTNDCLHALKNLDINVSTWDLIIIHVMTFKLDPETRKEWELQTSSNSPNDLPTFEQFQVFLESRFRALECIEPKKGLINNNLHTPPSTKALVAYKQRNFVGSKTCCEYCSEVHKLCFCKKFLQLPYEQRYNFVLSNNICFNCLGGNHSIKQCQNPTNFRVCKKRHHSLLHPTSGKATNSGDQGNRASTSVESSDVDCDKTAIVSCLSSGNVMGFRQVLLATALIRAKSTTGNFQVVRALVDQGSQASFITEATVQYLRLKRTPVKSTVTGLGADRDIVSKYVVTLDLKSCIDHNIKLQVKAYVLKTITSYLPDKRIELANWVDLRDLKLADPDFATPNKIDLLLGADVYGQIIRDGVKKAPTGHLIAQCTTLGWILSGVVDRTKLNNSTQKISVMHAQVNQNDILKKFLELEEQIPPSAKIFSVVEQKCEDLFAATTTRTSDGRYVVKLPFRDEEPACKGGNSRNIAVKRLISMERKLEKNKDLKEKYTKVLKEYLHLNHMRPVSEEKKENETVYLPHHAVVREDKLTTKVRIVFDASCKNENGVSLNDTLMVGPTLQSDLRHIILRWRVYPIGVVADIIKMYRQVRVTENDAKFQRIVWREGSDKQIQDYELTTVTFGTASAPYLAVKALNQVAIDEAETYPLAANRVRESFYMDDLMTGCSTVEDGKELYRQMKNLLKKGGFELQKWNSNSQELLTAINKQEAEETKSERANNKNLPETIVENSLENKTYEEKNIKLDITKILGLTWNRSNDVFKYSVQLAPTPGPETKRNIISEIARLFDPLGWLAPTVILAKVFIQRLWFSGVGWDEKVPEDLINEWRTYRNELSKLTEVRIPRWLQIRQTDRSVELHGFSDASATAYSAVVYTRSVDAKGDIHVALLMARTKVAPIKQVSIPRLELCGSVLLTRLLAEVAEAMHIPKENVRAWTDSTVVLSWLNSHPSRWKTFVGNRVSEILSTLDASQWAHVATKHNPADCASRGIKPSALTESKLWFSGPSFLMDKQIRYHRSRDMDTNIEKRIKVHISAVPQDFPWHKFSSLRRLIRIIAYCRRFLKIKEKKQKYLQKIELDEALTCCIKHFQMEDFSEEYLQLKEKGYIMRKDSKIRTLCPYIDNIGIIRAGGRLHESSLTEQIKHPILLSQSCYLSKLLVSNAHEITLHGGPQSMVNYLRSKYWIIGVKNLAKQHVRKCVICIKHAAKVRHQFMGSLPAVRCTPTRPFLHSGVDYAGPINIRTSKGRGYHAYKGYICVFVCMVTRAIHLEAVSDLSTQGFLAAFRRFVSRRGHCSQIWSDNGTNFVGAARELNDLKSIQQSVAQQVEAEGTQWHFIPPHAPHFGGLWEAAVKSAKHHLKRVIGDSTLTFEELSTLLYQIEACLNSRPMTVINGDDLSDPMPLTPGHFLIGEPLISIPDDNYEHTNRSSLTRWQLVQKMTQNFWRRWSQEYLSNLLHRYKWTYQVPGPNIGDVVLVKENNLPPCRWLLGRIIEKHPGPDQITRVVTLRTKSSIVKRPTSKICVLPVST